MNILYLSATKTAEAGNRVMIAWIDELLRRGHRITMCYPSGGGSMDEAFAMRPGVKVCHLPSPMLDSWGTMEYLTAVAKLVSITWRSQADVIHCNAESMYWVARLAAKKLKRPILAHLRFHFPAEFYGWLFKKPYEPDCVFTVSNALYEEEKKKLEKLIPPNRLKVLHNCLNIEQFTRECAGTLDGSLPREFTAKQLVGYFAVIQPRKQQMQLVELACSLKKAGCNVAIVAAGRPVDEEYYQACLHKVQELDVSDSICFLGHVPAVANLISSMKLTLSLAQYESFGISVLESMTLGVPVVAYNDPAVKEVLGGTGIVVPMDDLREMQDAVISLLANPTKLNMLGSMSRSRAEEKFSSPIITSRLLAHYNNLIEPQNYIEPH